MFNNEDFAAKSISDVKERRLKISRDLADGEKKIVIDPGFDLRLTEDRNYGQQAPTMIFMERRGNVAIDVGFYCGWNVLGERSLAMDGRDISLICLGFYYHRRFKKDVDYPEYAHQEKDCPLLGHKKCWGEAGSALYGDKLKALLLNFGSEAIWEEINQEFERYA